MGTLTLVIIEEFPTRESIPSDVDSLKNEKTRVMNWAEAVHTYNAWIIADEPSIDYCYSKGKAITFADIKDMDIEDVDFPKLEY